MTRTIKAIEIKAWAEGPITSAEGIITKNYRTYWDSWGGGEDWDEIEVDMFDYPNTILKMFTTRNETCPCCQADKVAIRYAVDTLSAELFNDGHAVGRYADHNYLTWAQHTPFIVGICTTTGLQFNIATFDEAIEDDGVWEAISNAYGE